MPRTTLDLDASVLRQLRRRGKQEQKSMGQVASELLARGLAGHEANMTRQQVHWKSWNLGTPRVDLEDKEAVRRLLDG